MKPSDLVDIINKIEDKFPVEKWRINNIHIWPLVRIDLKSRIFQRYHLPIKQYRRINKKINYGIRSLFLIRSLLKYYYAYLADFRNNASISTQANAVFLTYSLHRTPIKNVWHDRFCEPFIDALRDMNIKTLTFEVEDGGACTYEYRIPRYSPSVFMQRHIDYIKIRNKVFNNKVGSINEDLDGVSDFISYLENKDYGITVPDLGDLRYKANVISDIAEYFKVLFKKIKPSIAFVADYYSSIDRFGFNLACRQSGIHSVDIQHGAGCGKYHLSYARWNKVPVNGYEVLPSIFWCWDKEEADIISEWSKRVFDYHRPFLGGNLWLNLWRDKNNLLTKYYDDRIKQLKSQESAVILYTYDYLYGIPDWVLEVMKLTSGSFQWWIRIHPSQLNQRENIRGILRQKKITNFNLDSATDCPLAALLRHVDIHVTATSSCIEEAKYFNVPSIIMHSDGREFYSKLINSGFVVEAYTKDELISAIKRILGERSKAKESPIRQTVSNSDIIKKLLMELNVKFSNSL